MKSDRLRYFFLFLVCMVVLVLTSACLGAEKKPETSEKISHSDTSAVPVESTTAKSSSDHSHTTVASSATLQTTTAPAFEDAPGVFQPNYKAKYYIVVHLGSQSVAIYGKNENGYYNQLIHSFICSTGREGAETPPGKYLITNKFRWRWMDGGVYGQYSSSISKHYLFHSVPYLDKASDALDMKKYDLLGTPASHGCIRLCVRDAKWIYDNCNVGTQVYITEDPGPAGAGVPERNPSPIYNGWDPTDIWAKGNPYFSATDIESPSDSTEGSS